MSKLGLSGLGQFMSSSSTCSRLGRYEMRSSRALLASGLLGNPAMGGGKAAGPLGPALLGCLRAHLHIHPSNGTPQGAIVIFCL